MRPLRIVIIGRPNVGKSTLFNRLLGRRRAIVHDEPGVTRDRMEEQVTWTIGNVEYPILLVDTGGLGGERWVVEIQRQVDLALEEADVVLMTFDGQTGITPLDEELMRSFRKRGLHKKAALIGVVNKVDVEAHEERMADFYSSGLENVLTISAEHGRGIDDLKAAILEAGASAGWNPKTEPQAENGTQTQTATETETEETEPSPDQIPRLAIIGKPNVGKSTLINALLGKERMITSPIAGTTVDSVDSLATIGGKEFLLIDTAGIRRKSKTEQGIEVLSVVQARKALERADVAILLLDGDAGIADQDEKIGGLIEEVGCGVILAVNKWDTQRNNPKFTPDSAAERIRRKMAYLRYAPILFISALEGTGFSDLGELVAEILHQRALKVPTHELTQWLRRESGIHNPLNAKFYLCHQSGRYPPTFVCHVSDPEKVHFSLRRHLVNSLRERWGFMGSPVRVLFIKGKSGRPTKRPSQLIAAKRGKKDRQKRATPQTKKKPKRNH